ncbi:hypothetical protein ABPG75_000562 [Micractinium tetrahymenae]
MVQVKVEGAPGARWGSLRPADATWRGWDPWPKEAALRGAHRVAAAACRQLGFAGGVAQGDIYGGRTSLESPAVPAALLDNVDCPAGSEPGLSGLPGLPGLSARIPHSELRKLDTPCLFAAAWNKSGWKTRFAAST